MSTHTAGQRRCFAFTQPAFDFVHQEVKCSNWIMGALLSADIVSFQGINHVSPVAFGGAVDARPHQLNPSAECFRSVSAHTTNLGTNGFAQARIQQYAFGPYVNVQWNPAPLSLIDGTGGTKSRIHFDAVHDVVELDPFVVRQKLLSQERANRFAPRSFVA